MAQICILTDGTAQFTQPGFAGRELVRIIPFKIHLNGAVYLDGEGLKSNNLPASALTGSAPKYTNADQQECTRLFQSLAAQFREILVLVTSSRLSQIYATIENAALNVRGQAHVILIDSMTTSIGLGLLVQLAAEAAAGGRTGIDIESSIRKMVGQVYSLFSPAGLTYLHAAGYVDEGQAFVGEMLGLLPIFSLEEGQLSPIQKARNPRGVLEFFQEFLGEFDNLAHIAVVQGPSPYNQETHLLREHAQIHFPRTPFSEHTINLATASLFGPRTYILALLEAE